jgi:hypothetical protein
MYLSSELLRWLSVNDIILMELAWWVHSELTDCGDELGVNEKVM